MIQPISPDNFLSLYKQLPIELQDALSSEETTLKIGVIVENQHLTPEQRSIVVDFIGYTLLGKLSPKDFIKELKEALQIDTETAVAVSQDINRQIFLPVRDALREMYGISSPTIGEEQAPTPTSPTTPTPPLKTQESTSAPQQKKIDLSDIPSKKLNEISDKFSRTFSSFPTSSETFPAPIPEQGAETKNNFPLKDELDKKEKDVKNLKENEKSVPAVMEKNLPLAPIPVIIPPQTKPLTPLSPQPNKTIPPTNNSSQNLSDKYREPIEKKDVSNLPPPPPPKIADGTKLNGNIIDLKAIKPE